MIKKVRFALCYILVLLFLFSCEEEHISETEFFELNSTADIETEKISVEEQNRLDALNHRIKDFNERHAFTFSNRYGEPNLSSIGRIVQSGKPFLYVYKLKNKNNLLVSWEIEDRLFYRVINKNKKLTARTTKNTPIPSNIFAIFNEKINEGPELLLIENSICEEVIYEVPCTGDSHWPGDPSCTCNISSDCDPAFTVTYLDCNYSGGTGGGEDGGSPDLPDNGSGGGGETEDPFCGYEEPVCSTCITLYAVDGDDPDCPEPATAYEECIIDNDASWLCCALSDSGCTLEDFEKKQMAEDLNLSVSEANWLFDDRTFYREVQNFKFKYNNNQANAAASAFVKLGFRNLLYENFSQDEYRLSSYYLDSSFDCCGLSFPKVPSYGYQSSIDIIHEYGFLMTIWEAENPNITPGKSVKAKLLLEAIYNYSIGTIHTGLDICGLVFDLCDPINGVIYVLEGDGLNASISFMATIPIAGILATTGKYATRSINYGAKEIKLRFKSFDGNLYDFGSYGNLKRYLAPASEEQAHHIIAWSLREHPLIQKAAKAGWHPSDPIFNGINLSTTIHNGYTASHSIYIKRLREYLNNMVDQLNTPEAAEAFLNNLQNNIKNQFQNGKKLDEILFN